MKFPHTQTIPLQQQEPPTILPVEVPKSYSPLVIKEGTKPLLSTIQHPSQVALLTLEELTQLAQEVRDKIIATTSTTGGHLAPSLGVVDLTLAMLSVFDPSDDKIVWDVGHQAYAYKLLTGRADTFHTLRQKNGISGFPRRSESPYDHFGVGHSSTSISAALGMAVARDLAGEKHHVVSVIGDGSLTAGIAFEGLNQAGAKSRPFIVILNDNEMSIAKNVGALSLFMSRNLSSRWVRKVKSEVKSLLKSVPGIGDELYEIARRSKHSFKNFFTPGILFEALNFNYIGAVDGHDIEAMQKVLRLAITLDKPVLIHVLTQKGKGYPPAEGSPSQYHGVGKFEPISGKFAAKASSALSFTEAFGQTLCSLAAQNDKIVAITAAMPEGTGLTPFSHQFPTRFFDVGICEQHAVTFAAGLATQGYKPFVCLYSTFMQRAYDQAVHDVCIQNLPVVFCLDRAGLVGEDGATHQGAFDISFMRHIPNLVFCAPKDEVELASALASAVAHNGPFAIRYPRGLSYGNALPQNPAPLPFGKANVLQTGTSGIAIISIGHITNTALQAAQEVEKETGHSITVMDSRWIKPLDTETLKKILHNNDKIIVIEENTLQGGFSSAVIEFATDANLLQNKTVIRLGFPDEFVEHGPVAVLHAELGLDVASIKQQLLTLLPL